MEISRFPATFRFRQNCFHDTITIYRPLYPPPPSSSLSSLVVKWGAKKDGESSCAYITVGTGIGVGLVVNGQPVHGLLHPEAGHICLKRMPGDEFPGVDATFGGASVEGLSSTIALAARKARLAKWSGLLGVVTHMVYL